MSRLHLDVLQLSETSPQLDLTFHNSSLTAAFCRSPLTSEKVEVEIVVDDVTKYPSDHDFQFHLPSSHLKKDEYLLETLSRLATKGKAIHEITKYIESSLAIQTRYTTESVKTPDNKTTVVAVLGPSDFVEDDWMVADFCLFHGALGGTAKHETWFTSNSLLDHVKAHGCPIIHSSPDHEPRVIYDDTFKDFTTLVPKISMAHHFLESLQTTAQHAVCGDRIVVVIVAHGNDSVVAIGSEYVSRDALESSFAGINDGVSITIITTACVSGIWAVPFTNSITKALTMVYWKSFNNCCTRGTDDVTYGSPQDRSNGFETAGSHDVLELPKETGFSSIAFGAGSLVTKRKAAGPRGSYWAARARLLYEQLYLQSPGVECRAGNLNIFRHAKKVAEGSLPEEKCEDLVRQIQLRFRSDDQAQAVVSTLSSIIGKDLPHINDWDWDKNHMSTPAEYRDVVLASFRPLDPKYGKSSAFIKWAATECGPTVDQLQDIVNDVLLMRKGEYGRDRQAGMPGSCSIKSLDSMGKKSSQQIIV